MISHLSHVPLFATLETVAHQAPLSMGFSRQEYWSGLPSPPPEDLPNPGIKPRSLLHWRKILCHWASREAIYAGCEWVIVAQSSLTLFDPMDWSLPGSSIHEISQARLMEWVAISFSRGSFWPRDRTWVSCVTGEYLRVHRAKSWAGWSTSWNQDCQKSWNINNLRYADDTTLMVEIEEELKSLLMRVKEESEKVGFKLGVKTKILASGLITSWLIEGKNVGIWQILFSWASK